MSPEAEAGAAAVRAEEWQALRSIYPDFVPTEQPEIGDIFLLQVPVELSESLPIHIISEANPDALQIIELSHLPPILLYLILPPTYPSQQPPTIHSLQTSHAWLPESLVALLTRILLDVWDNECILGAWVEHIKNGDQLLSSLGILHSLDTRLVRLPNSSPHLLSPLLTAHNVAALRMRFQEATHTCPICLNRLLGTHCVALTSCSHVACRPCLKEFWGRCISEGDIMRVGCPDPDCVKEARRASVDEIKSVVSAPEVERWQWLLRKHETERDPTITHCPLSTCQSPVRPPAPATDGQPSGWDRLRTCSCGFSFCASCRRAWHGPITPCSQLTSTNFIQQYLQHPEGSVERRSLEQRYGRNNVLRVIANYQEEQANRKWIDDQTMACPGCRIRVQKNMGCNHMICSKCGQHFCYRCGAKLAAARPYAHFNVPGHPCYYKLFDFQEQNEEDWLPVEGFDV